MTASSSPFCQTVGRKIDVQYCRSENPLRRLLVSNSSFVDSFSPSSKLKQPSATTGNSSFQIHLNDLSRPGNRKSIKPIHTSSSNADEISDSSTTSSRACMAIAAALEAASSLPVKVLKSEGTISLISMSSEDFLALCDVQLDICAGMLAPGDNLTIFMRTPDSYASGQLELQCVCTYPEFHSGAHKGESFILSVDSNDSQPRSAETALVAHEAVELPERGALVLPLAKGSFVVGLLVAERLDFNVNTKTQNSLKRQEMRLKRPLWPPPKSLPSSISSDGIIAQASLKNGTVIPRSVFSDREQLEAAKIASTLALACVMDQRSLLVQQSAWQRGLLIDGLVDEVRAPLSAFRSLGRMLLPQLKRGELTRDIVDTMITQGDQIKLVFDRLQQVANPTPGPARSFDPKDNGGPEKKLELGVDSSASDSQGKQHLLP